MTLCVAAEVKFYEMKSYKNYYTNATDCKSSLSFSFRVSCSARIKCFVAVNAVLFSCFSFWEKDFYSLYELLGLKMLLKSASI